MRVFKNKWFIRFARRHRLDDTVLCEAILKIEHGLSDADLGGGVVKQRIARSGEGLSRGFRVILLFCVSDKAFFVYGFSKNDRGNIKKNELESFQELADEMLAYDDQHLVNLFNTGAIVEVKCDKKNL